MSANYSHFLSLVGGVPRTVDLSSSSAVLELGGSLQMDGSSSGHLVFSSAAVTSTYSLIWPAAQAASSGYVLTNDGTGNLSWSSPSAGSVTSVGLSLPSIFNVTVSPITSSGNLTAVLNTQSANMVWAGPASGSAAAPTFRSLVSADIPDNAANTTGTADNITATSNSTLTTLSSLSLPTSQLSGFISLTSQVSGVLPIANGGSGKSSAAAAFAALSPMTTAGDMIYENSSPAPARLAIGSSGNVLTVSGGLPVWAAPATSGTVTSVALADGSTSPIYSISNSPVTSSGTLTFTLENQSANMVFAGPASGSAAQPSFRSLIANDIPDLSSIYLALSGGTMSGAINMGTYQINNMADPSSAQDAATKAYVDAAINGLTWKGPAQAYAASNVPLTGSTPLVIDGYTVQNGDLLILGAQSTASQNGEYSIAIVGGAYTLTANGQPSAAGDAWLILNGTAYADSAFVATAAVPAAAFVEFAGPNAYTFSAPLALSGNTVSLHHGTGLTVNSGNLIADISNGLTLSSNSIVVEAADSSINVASGGISVAEDAAGAIVTGGSGIKVQVQNGIQITGNKLDIKVANASLLDNSSGLAVQFDAVSALATDGSGISVQVDGSTIDINGSNKLEVKAGGIGTSQLASASVTAAKLGSVTDGITLDQSGAGSTLEIKNAGVSATQLATGAFDQVTIVGGAGTAASVAQAPMVASSEVAGEAIPASLVALRYEMSADSGTPGQMWLADNDASSVDNFYVIGLALPASSLSQGDAVMVIEEGILNAPSHGLTVGKPAYLGSSGAITSTAPTSAGEAVVKVGMVKDANNIWVSVQVMGVN